MAGDLRVRKRMCLFRTYSGVKIKAKSTGNLSGWEGGIEDACEGTRDLSELIKIHAETCKGRRGSHTEQQRKLSFCILHPSCSHY